MSALSPAPARPLPPAVAELARRVCLGETGAASRACRLVDEGWEGAVELLGALYPQARHARLVGVTGPPGVGKSTLVSALVAGARARRERVAVVAVDPSSPLTGGSILGDRIRMQRHTEDPEVFIRSLGTRGAWGGLSWTAIDVARVLGAWGARTVFLETVGVGQGEVDIARFADCTLVVEAPGAGDDVQAAKAGLLEFADIFVVNKADRPGAEATAAHLRAMLALGLSVEAATARHGGVEHHAGHGFVPAALEPSASAWEVPVILCVGSTGQGIADIEAALDRFWLERTEDALSRKLERELHWRTRHALLASYREPLQRAVAQALVVSGPATDPYQATFRILCEIGVCGGAGTPQAPGSRAPGHGVMAAAAPQGSQLTSPGAEHLSHQRAAEPDPAHAAGLGPSAEPAASGRGAGGS